MASASLDLSAPNFRILIGGRDLPDQASRDVTEITVEEDVDAPGMFTFTLSNWDLGKNQVKWSDDEVFAQGGEATLSFGYGKRLDALITGDITGLEPEFGASGLRFFTVRGYDRRHRLLRTRRTRSFTNITDSQIAGQLASDAGLTASLTDSAVVHEYVFQNNQSDLEFLESRGRAIGYEVAVEGKALYFRPRPIAQNEALTLKMDQDLIEFYPRLSVLSQSSAIEVRGWDPAAKESLQSQATDGDEFSVMGAIAGPAASKKSFGTAPSFMSGKPVRSQPEADGIARGVYNEMALDYITGEGVAAGRTDIRAGKIVRITGLGTRFSGKYYITATVHSWSPRLGYRTAFTVRRNAS